MIVLNFIWSPCMLCEDFSPIVMWRLPRRNNTNTMQIQKQIQLQIQKRESSGFHLKSICYVKTSFLEKLFPGASVHVNRELSRPSRHAIIWFREPTSQIIPKCHQLGGFVGKKIKSERGHTTKDCKVCLVFGVIISLCANDICNRKRDICTGIKRRIWKIVLDEATIFALDPGRVCYKYLRIKCNDRLFAAWW